MPIKKSALLLIVLSVSSVGLAVFSSAITIPESVERVIPVKCAATTGCTQLNDVKMFSPWELISQIMFRQAA